MTLRSKRNYTFYIFLRTASADHYGQRGFFNHKKFRDGKAET